jgi:hypothetical protein
MIIPLFLKQDKDILQPEEMLEVSKKFKKSTSPSMPSIPVKDTVSREQKELNEWFTSAAAMCGDLMYR